MDPASFAEDQNNVDKIGPPNNPGLSALNDLRYEIERVRAEVKRALDHYDFRSELYTNSADLAADMASILRALLK